MRQMMRVSAGLFTRYRSLQDRSELDRKLLLTAGGAVAVVETTSHEIATASKEASTADTRKDEPATSTWNPENISQGHDHVLLSSSLNENTIEETV
jgi:hypothetical protein